LLLQTLSDWEGAAMNELQSQIKTLVDRSEITELLYRLGAVLDEKRPEDLRTIYTDQAVFEFSGNPDIGDLPSAIDKAKMMGKHFARTHHAMTSPIVELDGDTATVRSNLIATHVYRDDEPGLHYEAGMVYHFIAVRTAQGWRFSHAKLKQVWSNGQWDAPPRE
jgi:SnoaL-like domain